MNRALQSRAALAQQSDRHSDSAGALDNLLTTEVVAAKLHYASPRYFLKWANRKGIPRLRRGRRVLWRESVIVAFLEQKPWTRVHAATVAPISVVRPRTSLRGKADPGKSLGGSR